MWRLCASAPRLREPRVVCAAEQTAKSALDRLIRIENYRLALRVSRDCSDDRSGNNEKERFMSIGTVLLIVLILILVGALPSWQHSRSWGYGPSGVAGVVVIGLIVLLAMGRI